jgi:hypothetical protein
MDVFVTVQLTPEIDEVGAMDLLDEDHGDTGSAGGSNQPARAGSPFACRIIHMRDAVFLASHILTTALKIDHDQCRFSDDKRPFRVHSFRHLNSTVTWYGAVTSWHMLCKAFG